MSMPQEATDLVAYVRAVLFSDDTAATQEILESGDAVLEGVEPEDYRNALEQVMEEEGVPVESQEQIYDRLDTQDDYSVQGIKDHLQFVINDQDLTNTVDQSLDSHGEIHGDVVQENFSNVANATGEGSLAGQYVEGNQSQTGDGQQVGGDSGVQNQGNNSGQQAGWDATADNVTTGDNNTVGSDYAERVGQGQVSQDGAYINDSAQAFGAGDASTHAPDEFTSESNYTETDETTDSFNEFDNDTNTQTQTVNGGHDYEPVFEDDYKVVDDHDHHDGDDIDLDQDIAEIDG